MIRSVIFTLATIILLNSCDQASKEGVRVFGKVENPTADGQVVLNQFELTGLKPIDTVEVEASGKFEFYVNPQEATFYRLSFYDRQQMNLILDGQESEVEIMLEGDNPRGEISVKGSKHTKYVQQIEGMIRDQQQDVQDLNQQAIQARTDGDQQTMQRLTNEYYELMEVRQKELKEFIWTITPSLAAFYGLESLPVDDHFTFHDSVAQKFKEELPGNMFTEELTSRVESLRKLAIGAEAPEISLPNPEGETVTLSSLRGNYVLIDFWAAWCKPCRVENPNVVRLYEEYSDNNFEILGVSLDRDRNAWLKAIEQDGLQWKQVSDLKYFNSEAASDYQISAIPATYLIGPDGKIIAKGLRGPTLEAKLKEIFDQG